jgi:hypothetical protein
VDDYIILATFPTRGNEVYYQVDDYCISLPATYLGYLSELALYKLLIIIKEDIAIEIYNSTGIYSDR